MLAKLEEDRIISKNEQDKVIKYERNSSNKKLMTSHDMLRTMQERTIIDNRREGFLYH